MPRERSEPKTCGEGGADENALDVVGVVTFSFWGRLMRTIRVRVMRTLPTGIMIGRRLMLRLKMSLDFSSGVRFLSADKTRGLRIF
jgi:hypothetical protein